MNYPTHTQNQKFDALVHRVGEGVAKLALRLSYNASYGELVAAFDRLTSDEAEAVIRKLDKDEYHV